jgi:hypothetical protein
MWVDLTDAGTIGVPMAWFPRLLHAAPERRAQFRISATELAALINLSTR